MTLLSRTIFPIAKRCRTRADLGGRSVVTAKSKKIIRSHACGELQHAKYEPDTGNLFNCGEPFWYLILNGDARRIRPAFIYARGRSAPGIEVFVRGSAWRLWDTIASALDETAFAAPRRRAGLRLWAVSATYDSGRSDLRFNICAIDAPSSNVAGGTRITGVT
jgi:hypothetical protein